MNENIICISILIILLSTVYIYTELCNTKDKLKSLENNYTDKLKSLENNYTDKFDNLESKNRVIDNSVIEDNSAIEDNSPLEID